MFIQGVQISEAVALEDVLDHEISLSGLGLNIAGIYLQEGGVDWKGLMVAYSRRKPSASKSLLHTITTEHRRSNSQDSEWPLAVRLYLLDSSLCG